MSLIGLPAGIFSEDVYKRQQYFRSGHDQKRDPDLGERADGGSSVGDIFRVRALRVVAHGFRS